MFWIVLGGLCLVGLLVAKTRSQHVAEAVMAALLLTLLGYLFHF